MLTASYNTPASQWTQGIDRALGAWGNEVWGDHHFGINLDFNPRPGTLATTKQNTFVSAGTMADGTQVVLPGAAAAFQGYKPAGGAHVDFKISQDYPWSFGGPQAGKFSYDDVMKHELGHAFFADDALGEKKTPWELWAEKQPGHIFHDENHIRDPLSLMDPTLSQGAGQNFNDLDRQAMSASGIPTIRDDLFYLINGAKLDGGPGNDTAIWLNPFDQYNVELTGIERLQLGGKDPLTSSQQDIYKLYSAGLGRDPDLAGFQYWNASDKGLLDMARDFFHAPEFAQTAQAPTNRDYISSLYQNILGRAPEQAGLDYWDSRTDLDRSGLLANIAVAPENKIDTPTFLL